jgi:prefoldin subunit 5
LEPLANEITALRNDIKEIYNMISELQSATITDKEFKKRSLEEKLLTINAELLSAAKQAGIVLPRN